MNWKTEKQNRREVLVCGDFKIIPCKNGKCQLREAGKMKGTFTNAKAAKGQAEFLLEQRQPKAAKAAPKRSGGGRHPKLLGHSICAVVKALGKAGMKAPEAEVLLKKHGIEMASKSLRVQLGFGRNPKSWERHGKPAPLTESEIEQLVKGQTGAAT